MSQDVKQLVAEEHPGVDLESPVQGWVFLRRFEAGIECYSLIEEKTGLDDRWAGICFFHLHEDMRAVELFYRAISRGVEAARINLAHALGYIERGDEVIPELLKVDRESLPIYDKVLYFRVKSLHEETSGDLRTALQDAETAWDLVQGAPQFSILAPDILSQLAVLNGRVGQAKTALKYIERNLSISTGVDAVRARIHRAQILITLGQFAEAISELTSLQKASVPKHLVSILQIHLGDAEWALGNMDQAIDHFERSTELASELEIGYEEFLARVGLAVLYANEDRLDLAYEHLGYAERLVSDRSDRLYYRFREILVNKKSGNIGSTAAVMELRTVENELGKMGALQEQGWVRFHIAHELWCQDTNEYLAELQQLEKLAVDLKNPAFLTRELVLLPQFAEVASSNLTLLGRSEGKLSVRSLGTEAILLNGEPVKLPLTRGVELFSYFLIHESATLSRVLTDLFSAEKARSARSYFHQFRYQLAHHVSGVSIVFDRETRQYHLKSDFEIEWDVAWLRSGDKRLAGKRFLPSATSRWAIETDARLKQELTNSSIKCAGLRS